MAIVVVVVLVNICVVIIDYKDINYYLPSVLWHWWLGIRKSIQPVEIWVMTCWCGCLSGERF